MTQLADPPVPRPLDLQEVLEAISDGFLAFDREWRYTYVNAQVEALVGKTRAELLGRVLWEVLPHLAPTQLAAGMRRAMEERVPPPSPTSTRPTIAGWRRASFPPRRGSPSTPAT